MCLLLLYVSSPAAPGRYRVILASNRDESFNRPAKPAHFWERNRNVVGGMDMTPDKEGGTWLAASRQGRIGVLLNVAGTSSDPKKKGRGFIVSDFLTSVESDLEHLVQLQAQASDYNPFHLVTVDLKNPLIPLRHFCNIDPKVTEFSEGCYSFCNSSLKKPYRKAIAGREKLEDIVSRLGNTTDSKEELVSSLVSLLRSEEQHSPDPVIDALPDQTPEMRNSLSAICVRPPEGTSGTRTNTVILVDEHGQVDFYEWTLKLPVQGDVFDWLPTHHQFEIVL